MFLPEPQASLLNGIIFGIPLKTGKIFYEQIKTVGLLHIVVLSGTNISFIAAIVASLTKSFGKQLSILISILIIIIFIIFISPQAPVVRAGFMGVLTLVAIIYGRVTYPLFLLFLSALFTLAFWPQWLKTVSFQLSYSATLGIIIFSSWKLNLIKTSSKNKFFKTVVSYINDNLKITLSAQLFTLPIILIYFKEISLISPLANLLVTPVIPTLMIFGFLTAFLGKISYFLGILPSYICYGITSYMTLVIGILSKIPLAMIRF